MFCCFYYIYIAVEFKHGFYVLLIASCRQCQNRAVHSIFMRFFK